MQREGRFRGLQHQWGLQLPTGEKEKWKMENGKWKMKNGETNSAPEESALGPDPESSKIILPKIKILPLTLLIGGNGFHLSFLTHIPLFTTLKNISGKAGLDRR